MGILGMSELKLTEEELAANHWLETDDATVGKVIKKAMLDLQKC